MGGSSFSIIFFCEPPDCSLLHSSLRYLLHDNQEAVSVSVNLNLFLLFLKECVSGVLYYVYLQTLNLYVG